jgi:uroporphyrinogen decarboxylase
MIPAFEETVIEERERTLVVQDWKGNICEISKDFDVTYLRLPKDFVTRRWIRCPVENREDWEAMKARYNPHDPGRVPPNIEELGKTLASRAYVTGLNFNGPFWQLREWIGFENLCILFLDNPEFVRDMTAFWTEYVARLMERVLPHVDVDYVHISEDMAYKGKSMISPAMTREFLMPSYILWNEIIRSYNCPLFMMDSDGYIGELIPIWIECGINECDPIEAAALNDIAGYRKMYGRKIAFSGGVDKRAIAKGGSAIRREMERLEPVIRSGGYIPGCDHGIPSDVGWREFIEYCDILARMTGWK